MIKYLFFTGALAISSVATGQSAPNGGFESWDGGLYEEPSGWATANVLTLLGAPPTVTKSTDFHGGSFSAKIETVLADIDLDENGTNDTLPGVLYLGTLDLFAEESTFGAPFTGRPDSLLGWYKYAPVNGDQFAVEVSLTKWNTVTGERDIIASGSYLQPAAAASFKRLSAGLTYANPDTPDSVSIMIVASAETPSPGTALWIDDLSFFTNAELAVVPKPAEAPIQLYPNPARDVVNVVLAKDASIRIFNALGMEVETLKGTASKTVSISTSKYDNGVYLLKTDTGIVHRFVVKH